jgi:hypothetical protein
MVKYASSPFHGAQCPDLYVGVVAVFSQLGGPETRLKIQGAIPQRVERKEVGAQNRLRGTRSDVIWLEALKELVECLKWCYLIGKPALVQGLDLVGKRALLELWAAHHFTIKDEDDEKVTWHEVVLHADSTVEDLFGRVMPKMKTDIDSVEVQEETGVKTPAFQWKDGPVTLAMERGQPLLLRSVHLPNPAVLESLNGVLGAKPGSVIYTGSRRSIVKPGFFCSCHDASIW